MVLKQCMNSQSVRYCLLQVFLINVSTTKLIKVHFCSPEVHLEVHVFSQRLGNGCHLKKDHRANGVN